MSNKPIIIVAGEPNSIFVEIFIKSIQQKKFKTPFILVMSLNVLRLQMKFLNYKYPINIIIEKNILNTKLSNRKINIIDVNFESEVAFQKISGRSRNYIDECFSLALKLIKKGVSNKLINGPVSKKFFLGKKYQGVTEYLAKKTNTKNFAMLIYNKNLAVSPLTTHLPIKLVAKTITKKLIVNKITLLNNFYENFLNKKPMVAITGINPHCESISNFNEDIKIVEPATNCLKKNININGPFAADTIFIKKNRIKYDLIVGMYHDQVLAPLKTLYEYDAINITVGLPFQRVSPDHGPNEDMLGKNLSNNHSLIACIKFLENLNDKS